ncbi:hypothetical protein LEP1GSC044_3591 [Leptospira kirschneri serovar Grippotyphosa str. RM52]|nr:hypothetical protein LEP1GSC044_3591 [Leptospira kirschneri serovar Grippotyphosa str. RM52]
MDTTNLSFLIPDGSVGSAIDAGFGRHECFFKKILLPFYIQSFLFNRLFCFTY